MNLRILPVCQREGCEKPLHPKDQVPLLIRRHGEPEEEAVFCRECAEEIQAKP